MFSQFGVSVGDVARALGLSYPYVSGMLSGNILVPEKQELRIKELVEYIKKEFGTAE